MSRHAKFQIGDRVTKKRHRVADGTVVYEFSREGHPEMVAVYWRLGLGPGRTENHFMSDLAVPSTSEEPSND